MSKQPKNQKAYCPVCGIGVTVADDTEETECLNCSYQFQTNWGRTVQALRYNKLKASNEKLVEALNYAKSFIDGYGSARLKENLGRESMDAVLKEINRIVGKDDLGTEMADAFDKLLTNICSICGDEKPIDDLHKSCGK